MHCIISNAFSHLSLIVIISRFVCIARHIKSGRKLECYSNQPGVQFYTGNFSPTYRYLNLVHLQYPYSIAMIASFCIITFLAYVFYLLIFSVIFVYIGNFIPTDGSVKGKEGVVYSKHGGFCLETQVYPDSVNQKSFPCDSVLRPGKIYDHRVTYKFLDF